MTPEEARNEIDNHFRFGDAEPSRTPVEAPDHAYNFMLRSVLMNGEIIPPEEERTGTGTIKRFGLSYMVDVGARFPILTTKKVFFSSVVAEYLFFLTGATNVEELTEYTGVWDDWADEDGNLETVYGRFWRNFPRFPVGSRQVGEAAGSGPYADGGGVDQIKHVVRSIKKNPYSRRHHVTAWHPANALASKLPPCHHSFTFYVSDGKLNIEVHQRSGDLALGVPFNMSGYALVLNLIAREVGLEPGLLKHNITDAHIYHNHLDGVVEQIKRPSKHTIGDPTLSLSGDLEGKSIFDLELSDVEHFSLEGYDHHDPIKFDVAV
jgi:thymidylate synthase